MTNPSSPTPFAHPSFHGQMGIARNDITPPLGIYARNWGAATHDVADSIHRPLQLTALTLSDLDQQSPLVFIDADLGWWKTPQVFNNFHRRLLTELSLQPEHLIFALTHTHAAPPLSAVDESLPGSALHRQWMEDLYHTTVATVRQAMSETFEGRLDWHHGRCGLATVRDLPDPDPQQSRIVCGYAPHETADDTLLVGRLTDTHGTQRATLVNYACHPTTMAWENSAISPDYIGAMRELIQEHTQAPALFMVGACGDLGPRYQYVADTTVADQHGRQLGHAALAVLHDMAPSGQALVYQGALESGAVLGLWKHEPSPSSTTLRGLQQSVRLPIKDWPSADALEQQRQNCTDRTLQERLLRKRDIRRGIGDSSEYDLSLWGWRLGDAILVGCCCEPYSRLQRELRQRFPEQTIACMNLINGSLGYLPPASLYQEEIYPVWQTPFDRGSLEQTIEAMSQIIAELLEK